MLLDTCVVLWLASEPSKLSKRVRRAIDEADDLYLSDVSVWEISMKWEAGKIHLPAPPRRWVEEQVSRWQLNSVSVLRNHLYRSAELPTHHRDPFDRLLISQAIESNFALISPDKLFRRYPVEVIW